jgi:hypothetical protein
MRQIRENKHQVVQDIEIKELADILVEAIIWQASEKKEEPRAKKVKKKTADQNQYFY